MDLVHSSRSSVFSAVYARVGVYRHTVFVQIVVGEGRGEVAACRDRRNDSSVFLTTMTTLLPPTGGFEHYLENIRYGNADSAHTWTLFYIVSAVWGTAQSTRLLGRATWQRFVVPEHG